MKRKLGWKNGAVYGGMFGLYFLGLALGGLYIAKTQESYFTYYIQSFLESHRAGQLLPVFSLSFLSVLGLLLLLQLCGFSCMGAPFILAVQLLRGICVGMVEARIYLQHGGKGLLFILLVLLLPTVLQSLLLAFFAARQLEGSVQLFRSALLHRSGLLRCDVAQLVQTFILFAAAGLAVSLLEGALSLLFGPVFRF